MSIKALLLPLFLFCAMRGSGATATLGFVSVDASDTGVSVTVANLTGDQSLAPDFPVSDEIVLLSSAVTLTFQNGSSIIHILGDIGPGLWQFPSLQFSDPAVFSKLELTFLLSQEFLTVGPGGQFGPAVLNGSAVIGGPGQFLSVGDLSIIAAHSAGTVVPEPAAVALLTTGFAALIAVRRLRS